MYSPYVLPPVVAAVVLFIVAASGFRSRHVPGAFAFGVSMFQGGVWGITYALEVWAPAVGTKVLSQEVRFVALAGMTPALLWMTLDYTGNAAWLTRARVAALLAIPAAVAVAGATMSHHSLMRYNFRIEERAGLDVLLYDTGPLVGVYSHYCNVLILAVVALLTMSMRGSPLIYRVRTSVLIVSVLLPGVVNALFMAGISPIPGYNISPALMVFTGLLLVWGVFRLRLMELVPLARTTVVDNMADLVFVLDSQDVIVDMNAEAERVMGLLRSKVVGKPVGVVFEPHEALARVLAQAGRIREEVALDHEQRSGMYQVSVSPIHDRGGGLLGRVVTLHDVTDLRRAREVAESADRAKTAFLANVSHEIRTPMNVILGFAELMARDQSLAAEHREQMELVRNSGEHLLSLLSDTLDLSKIEAGRMVAEPVNTDVHTLVVSIQQLFQHRAEEKGLTFLTIVDPDVPCYIRTDARKLRQILINLMSNALKFTPTGSVTLRLSRLSEPEPGADRRIRFTVEDTGVGIAPGEMATLFDPFTQASEGRAIQDGTGLGLALSRQLARVMGGDLQAASQVGCGSSFSLDVPLVETPPHRIASQPVVAERRALGVDPDQPQRRVLVVDDHAPNRRLLVLQLAALNAGPREHPVLDVREAANAAEALALWDGWRPDIIFLDMRLPDRSGAEVAAEIRRLAAGARVVIVGLSASVLEVDRAAFIAAGCDGFIGKPYREQEIPAVLSQHLGLRFRYEGSSPTGGPGP